MKATHVPMQTWLFDRNDFTLITPAFFWQTALKSITRSLSFLPKVANRKFVCCLLRPVEHLL
jgi:hypothetical protein